MLWWWIIRRVHLVRDLWIGCVGTLHKCVKSVIWCLCGKFILGNHQNASNYIKSTNTKFNVESATLGIFTHLIIHYASMCSWFFTVSLAFSHILILISVQTSVPSCNQLWHFLLLFFQKRQFAFAAEFTMNTWFSFIH